MSSTFWQETKRRWYHMNRSILCWLDKHEWIQFVDLNTFESKGRRCLHCEARQEVVDGKWCDVPEE